ncbi:uncharacterized protein LOC110923858 [Helianthus annuus]|uniref:uncharacterized protein LOC110923858 n=1 Tax=Helianthus annuus TaxID=4232 RepID=UPI000B8FCE14|nr:uncharacterized protein LOC110923858 [Helianthus annuus]
MDSVAAWNVRGLNHTLKQKEVQKFVRDNSLQVLAILESHVQVANLEKVCKKVFNNWDWTSNGTLCDKGTRVIVGCNVDNVELVVLHATNQVVHVQVRFKKDNAMVNVSFVYASNNEKERKQLWESLKMHKGPAQLNPWVIMGDFNVGLNLDDTCMGSSNVNSAMKDFIECVNYLEVFDVRAHGMHYTWSQCPKKGIGIRKKLDRILVNVSFVDRFVDACGVFLPNGISDHSPALLKIIEAEKNKPKPFKFTNLLAHKKEFLDVVTNGWAMEVMGVPMFLVVKKLRGLKHPLRLLLMKQGNIHKKVTELKAEMESLQSILDADPFNLKIKEAESICVKKYLEATLDEERFLKQKAKQKWLEAGDLNTTFFHNVGDKSHVFSSHTKVTTPEVVTDYRPISCCNVVYKAISKILTARILEGLKGIISENQSAFVPGRRISDNVMLTQELMHNYHRQSGPPRCAMKVDIQKAYDTVDWRFLRDVLHGFGFNQRFILWIMECITTTSFSISVNGNVHGYFKGKRGLRQGDPMSPYLFTMVMEILTLILNKAAELDSSFRFHNKCEKQMIINVCFADDLFLFARGDVGSVKVVMRSLKQFEEASGLVPSNAKSTIFYFNVPVLTRTRISSLVPFDERKLPIRYLGVPLLASRLLIKDCKVLVERMSNRINDWKNRFLSFAGRLQLILSVLSSIHVYWASVLFYRLVS